MTRSIREEAPVSWSDFKGPSSKTREIHYKYYTDYVKIYKIEVKS